MNTNKIIRELGINDPKALRYASDLAHEGLSKTEIIEKVLKFFGNDPKQTAVLEKKAYPIFGNIGTDIPYNAVEQMDVVMSIPPVIQGALMPDAHLGYAMPIGGVAGMSLAISPSFVGYDIACRVSLSVLDIVPSDYKEVRHGLAAVMQESSRFGLGSHYERPRDHGVMDDVRWQIAPAKELKGKAQEQLGTSGGGNHFFDAVVGRVEKQVPWLVTSHGRSLDVGERFIAIMTHSGSRGTGHQLAKHYQELAVLETRSKWRNIPKGYEWLDIMGDAGQEYMEIMSLMGNYAKANHDIIHRQFSENAGIPIIATFENHHNFAWMAHDSNLIIHRKGATPAELGQIGIIPGSSGTVSYLVQGLGNPTSLYSSSHGAGRLFSRSEAKRRHEDELYNVYKKRDIIIRGVEKDETFAAYKDIYRVMELQEGILVETIATLYPDIVIMGGKADDGD